MPHAVASDIQHTGETQAFICGHVNNSLKVNKAILEITSSSSTLLSVG